MIVNSTLGSAVLDTSQPFGIPYHGRINLPDDLSTATFELPNGEQRPYHLPDSQREVRSWNSTRYGHGTQVFKVRDGAPPQTATQQAAGQRFTDYAIIHSFGGYGTKALIGGAVVDNGSYVYHSPISGNWLVGVRGNVEYNVATVQITLTPFGVIGEDARQPITRTLTLQDAGQNDADSKPILGVYVDWQNKIVSYAEWRFGVALHTASHDGGHASLVVWTEYTSYIATRDGGYYSGWNWNRTFPVGWLALKLSDLQDATALTPPDAVLSVQFDRVQTMGARFTDDYTGCTLHDQSILTVDERASITRPTVRFLTDGTQEVIKESAWGPDYDDLHADLTTSYIIDRGAGKAAVSKRIQGYDKRVVSLWYAPGESTPTPVKLTHYNAISVSYDDSVDVQGSQHVEWTLTWQYDAQGVPQSAYLDYEGTANVSGSLIWRTITKTSTRVAVMLGDAIMLEGGAKSTRVEVVTWDYTATKQVSYHDTATVTPSFYTLPADFALLVGHPGPAGEDNTTVDNQEMDVGNFSPEFHLNGIDYAAGQDYILPHLMDIGNEPLTVTLVVDDQPRLLLWPDMRMVDPQTDPRSSGAVTGTYALSAPMLLQCATHPIQDDPAHQTPLVYLSYWSANLGSAPHEQKVNLICI